MVTSQPVCSKHWLLHNLCCKLGRAVREWLGENTGIHVRNRVRTVTEIKIDIAAEHWLFHRLRIHLFFYQTEMLLAYERIYIDHLHPLYCTNRIPLTVQIVDLAEMRIATRL